MASANLSSISAPPSVVDYSRRDHVDHANERGAGTHCGFLACMLDLGAECAGPPDLRAFVAEWTGTLQPALQLVLQNGTTYTFVDISAMLHGAVLAGHDGDIPRAPRLIDVAVLPAATASSSSSAAKKTKEKKRKRASTRKQLVVHAPISRTIARQYGTDSIEWLVRVALVLAATTDSALTMRNKKGTDNIMRNVDDEGFLFKLKSSS